MYRTYKEKMAQADCEAKATLVALLLTIAVWAVCGFGLAGLDVTVFHMPLWVVGGTIGTWAFAIVVAVVLARRVFADFDLGEEGAAAAAGEAAGVAAMGKAAEGFSGEAPKKALSESPATGVGDE